MTSSKRIEETSIGVLVAQPQTSNNNSSSNGGILALPQKVKAGPEPLLLSRKEIDVLYDIFDTVRKALELLQVEYIVTGGSLLGAIRQHSILFCDDDIDIAIIDPHYGDERMASVYESTIVPKLQLALDQVAKEQASLRQEELQKYVYQIKPWEGGDRIRSKRFNNVFLDLFVLRKYPTFESFVAVIGTKKNGQTQPKSYIQGILDTIEKCVNRDSKIDSSQKSSRISQANTLFPFWQFSTRKAIELWPKEVYLSAPMTAKFSDQAIKQQKDELFPLQRNLKFGPLTGICGPHTPVTLLKRAFGDDCFEVYYRSISHQQGQTKQSGNQSPSAQNPSGSNTNNKVLPPKVAPGGTWEASPKATLEDQHYLPMQTLARKRRRPTMHCKGTLFEYLRRETIREEDLKIELTRTRKDSQTAAYGGGNVNPRKSAFRPRKTIYMDGVFDLFHFGHLEAIRQCAALGDRVILGVTGDSDAEGYKRKPIVPEFERTAIVAALEEVDDVVCPCPLIVTQDFMEKHDIDLVVHGFANDVDANRQKEFFSIPMALGKFQRIGYYNGLSTTDRIKNIRDHNQKEICRNLEAVVEKSMQSYGPKSEIQRGRTISKQGAEEIILANNHQDEKLRDKAVQQSRNSKPQWFGATLAAASNYSATIPTKPFPLNLRIAIESHIEKARLRRREALHAIKIATGASAYDSILRRFELQQERWNLSNSESIDTEFERDAHRKLVASLLVSVGLPSDTNLSQLHKEPLVEGKSAKDRLLHALTQNHRPFQESFDTFVRKVCIPRMVQAMEGDRDEYSSPCTKVFYQAFPCLRIVQPGEFSIGPHSDVAYGHHPCSVNGYVSLTEPDSGSDDGRAPVSALFLESRPGAEDWHSLFGRSNNGKSRVRLFAGALNLHWTTENLTEETRVTFDFRMIDSRVFESLKDGGLQEEGQKDVFRATPGYYHVCHRGETGEWIRDTTQNGEFECPDFRVGFPWTVKNWETFWKKHAKHNEAKTTR